MFACPVHDGPLATIVDIKILFLFFLVLYRRLFLCDSCLISATNGMNQHLCRCGYAIKTDNFASCFNILGLTTFEVSKFLCPFTQGIFGWFNEWIAIMFVCLLEVLACVDVFISYTGQVIVRLIQFFPCASFYRRILPAER